MIPTPKVGPEQPKLAPEPKVAPEPTK